MATPIKPRRTATAGKVPTTSDIADGELCVNTADAKTYIRAGSSIVSLTPKSWVQITQSAYDALGTKDANTLYVIVG